MSEKEYHIPVMLKETLQGLVLNPDGIYVDVTFGGGGHSRGILDLLSKKGKLIAFDQDQDACQNIFEDDRFLFVQSNFCYLKNFLRYHGISLVDGILADLGVSSHHFDESERGFSFRLDGELDMRMNRKTELTAATVLNTYTEEQLADVFYHYGELSNARKIAATIVKARDREPFQKILPFVEMMKRFFPRQKEKKGLACVFQALRIEVNHELEALQEFLQQTPDVLKPGGRLAVLTYHSLEDRMVKNFMKTGNFEGILNKDFFGNIIAPFKPISGKAITPQLSEIEKNPRARSAKLRIAELIDKTN
ncbi:MAG TPA: 16S rRNA (cytosine(1402)-N(4))-methyltransferase RsmH [Paludibacteraceae bacterium]|nr:16S rRNA (cytosine(1402)-N(4))-methyltransferase RsmH [Paludibacteraceae bacterium]HOJ66197.1 16S rRNA (cytosine(1402)-N(4))-methyltransferase RsmH [Paludibacteraceae bacterium]HOL29670.1 16S rRNA (cytosine(1402)-N(4))-methyltransferase RsmH [Paludibacteraceae bacterium]HON02447.1 16S rRNA (cytosine(1402)-N(4))-methyltransferase RsmH [Paludibacteraceae bacterium]HOR38579.1 16S rRNA (cytosine(1402)-N(4))-methyltransferase RsmH [Paludibacteraceae bacterium]